MAHPSDHELRMTPATLGLREVGLEGDFCGGHPCTTTNKSTVVAEPSHGRDPNNCIELEALCAFVEEWRSTPLCELHTVDFYCAKLGLPRGYNNNNNNSRHSTTTTTATTTTNNNNNTNNGAADCWPSVFKNDKLTKLVKQLVEAAFGTPASTTPHDHGNSLPDAGNQANEARRGLDDTSDDAMLKGMLTLIHIASTASLPASRAGAVFSSSSSPDGDSTGKGESVKLKGGVFSELDEFLTNVRRFTLKHVDPGSRQQQQQQQQHQWASRQQQQQHQGRSTPGSTEASGRQERCCPPINVGGCTNTKMAAGKKQYEVETFLPILRRLVLSPAMWSTSQNADLGHAAVCVVDFGAGRGAMLQRLALDITALEVAEAAAAVAPTERSVSEEVGPLCASSSIASGGNEMRTVRLNFIGLERDRGNLRSLQDVQKVVAARGVSAIQGSLKLGAVVEDFTTRVQLEVVPVEANITADTPVVEMISSSVRGQSRPSEGLTPQKIPPTKVQSLHSTLRVPPCCYYSLHACGDLSVSMIRQFISNRSCRALVNVGCCYNFLSDASFPLSNYVQSAFQSLQRSFQSAEDGPTRVHSHSVLNKNMRQMACQCPRRWGADAASTRGGRGGTAATLESFKSLVERAMLEAIRYKFGAQDTTYSKRRKGARRGKKGQQQQKPAQSVDEAAGWKRGREDEGEAWRPLQGVLNAVREEPWVTIQEGTNGRGDDVPLHEHAEQQGCVEGTGGYDFVAQAAAGIVERCSGADRTGEQELLAVWTLKALFGQAIESLILRDRQQYLIEELHSTGRSIARNCCTGTGEPSSGGTPSSQTNSSVALVELFDVSVSARNIALVAVNHADV